MKKIIMLITAIVSILVMGILFKYSLYVLKANTQVKKLNKVLEKFEGEVDDEVFDLNNVEEILPYIESRQFAEIRAGISALKFINDEKEKMKAIKVLEDLWINGFPQYTADELIRIDCFLRRIKVALAGALYEQTNQDQYLSYIKSVSNSGNPFEQDLANSLLSDISGETFEKLEAGTLFNSEEQTKTTAD